MNDAFDVLQEYFAHHDDLSYAHGGSYKKTAMGQFVPSPLRHIRAALDYLVKIGVVNSSGLFLDAGCGDGRIVALTAFIYKIPSIGVEYDIELALQSEQHLSYLKQLGLMGAPVEIIRGDFVQDLTYRKADRNFEDFTIVFNYINNEQSIAEKIAAQSLGATKFLLFGAFPVPEYVGLPLQHNLELVPGKKSDGGVLVKPRPVDQDYDIDPDSTYMQVYARAGKST
jgi:hypothetical protein